MAGAARDESELKGLRVRALSTSEKRLSELAGQDRPCAYYSAIARAEKAGAAALVESTSLCQHLRVHS